MWGYQQHFRVCLEVEVKNLFKKLDEQFDPKIFLIGLLVDNRPDRHSVCLEPEDCGFNVKYFEKINDLASELESVDEESRMIHTHPVAQANHEAALTNKARIDAIKKILRRYDIYSDTERFVSYPSYVEGYLVFVVLEIKKNVLNKYYSLSNRTRDRFSINRSLIDSTIDVFLKESNIALKDPNKGFGAIERRPDELLKDSAIRFMYTISGVGKNFYGLHGLYDTCNMISSLKYEGAEGIGAMIIAAKDHPNIKLTLELEKPIKTSDYRKVRKFLELSTSDSFIISDSALIYGLGEVLGKYNPKDESLFVIDFVSHYKWEISHDKNKLMVVEYQQPKLPKDSIDKEKFYSDIKRIFLDIERRQINDLWELTIQATKQKHGTMLVISSIANEESKRLGEQCFSIKPEKLTSSMIQQVTTIDGAVLLDQNSTCYAIGVILDGLATAKGDSSRGARYNSAIRYFDNFSSKGRVLIVIISEDGMINLIPNLKNQIDHALIENKIQELRELNKLEKVKREKYYPIINWFEEFQFYLTQSECDEINMIRKELEGKESEPASLWIVRNDLKPNEEMNESYYK